MQCNRSLPVIPAGKSSLAAALFRLVEAAGGRVEVDGVDVSRVALSELRAKLSAIPQDPVLFAGTIRCAASIVYLCTGKVTFFM